MIGLVFVGLFLAVLLYVACHLAVANWFLRCKNRDQNELIERYRDYFKKQGLSEP